jgi:hypothetical protein
MQSTFSTEGSLNATGLILFQLYLQDQNAILAYISGKDGHAGSSLTWQV